jgi:hypothetical protein
MRKENTMKTDFHRYPNLITLSICNQLKLSNNSLSQVKALLEILDRSAVPVVWKTEIFNSIKYGEKIKSAEAKKRYFQYLDWELSNLVYYIEQTHKILKSNRKLGKSFTELMQQAANESSPFKDQALRLLIAIDPRWIYEDFIMDRIVNEARQGNHNFFVLLGEALRKKHKKAFVLRPKSGCRSSRILAYLKKNSRYGRVLKSDLKYVNEDLPRGLKELSRRVDLSGKLTPTEDMSPNYLRKLLKRYNLISRIPSKF